MVLLWNCQGVVRTVVTPALFKHPFLVVAELELMLARLQENCSIVRLTLRMPL